MWSRDRHPHLRRLWPLLGVERALKVGRCRDGVAGALEDEEDPVARPVHLAAAAVAGGGPDELADPRVHVLVAIAERVEQAGRPLDVGEEQGHGSRREVAGGEGAARWFARRAVE